MTERTELITSAIDQDANFAGRVISSIKMHPVVAFCISSYFSLFVHEGHARLSEVSPQLVLPLSPIARSVAARSRHSLKFFEDTKRGLDGQISYFEKEILPAHEREFTGNTWLPFARKWETDLGLYRYDGMLVSTTHSATYAFGLDPRTMFAAGAGQELTRITSEFGNYFAQLGATLDSGAESFLSYVDVASFGSLGEDVQSWHYYRQIFNGATTPSINCLLSVFQSSMNFVDRILTTKSSLNSTEYSPYKIRFLTAYQILRSLEILRTERASELTVESLASMDGILSTSEARMVLDPTARPFRNTLMHYGPDNRTDISSVDKSDLIGSLVPLCYSGISAAQFSVIVDECVSHTAAGLNSWAAR